jgi:hypothetical protein
MPSTYRDDQAVIEERLARLEASHLERQMTGLRRLRSSIESDASPPDTKSPTWPIALLMMTSMNALRAFGHSPFPVRLAAVVVLIATCVVSFAQSKLFRAWRHRRKQRKALAKIDAELAALDHRLPMRVDTSTLEAARTRIAELEAEEAAAPDEASEAATRSSVRP